MSRLHHLQARYLRPYNACTAAVHMQSRLLSELIILYIKKGKTFMNYHEYTEELENFEHEYTPIELIGLAKNYIVQTMEVIDQIAPEYSAGLSQAYALLHEVQEYLYEN